MKNETALSLLSKIESDDAIQHLIAQSDSRYLLFNVREPVDNFPKYTAGLDEKLSSLALSYISIGCTLFESGDIEQSVLPLEKGATILGNIYSPEGNRNEYSTYFILTSSLAFYAASQYSKSFIILKHIEFDTVIANLISLFLKRQYKELDELLTSIFLDNTYNDKTIAELEDDSIANNRIYVLILAKSLSCLIEFIFSGNQEWLIKSKGYISDLLELVGIDADPSLWWVIRLFIIIIKGFQNNSLWNTVGPIIDSDGEMVNKYIATLAFQKNPIVELFYSQKIALPKAINESGAVISLPTSAGKTRIAEIAMLKCLLTKEENKVLYLAPFKSLAYEIEEAVSKIFAPLGIEVSHLYGGGQFSKLDEMMINESRIVIATPEKAKAILRGNSDLKNSIKLVVVDEGHLIGPEERYILSELLIEELRIYNEVNNGKMLLLSAVLPNSEEIAQWITGDKELKVASDWRPSTQRLGLLEYTGGNVNIKWNDEIGSFNRSFINPIEIRRPRSTYTFPSNKKQAIAASALKLSNTGSVLIFVCRKNMVLSQSREILTAMGDNPKEHLWKNEKEWEKFKLCCEEAYGVDSELYKLGKIGILCHHSGLSTEVKLSIEKLMRIESPRIVVSTSTLGQGVNIGISTIIFANVWFNKTDRISQNDFWNIAGRAGRSFVDREGKILFVVDASLGRQKARREKNLALSYFNGDKKDNALSGLLYIVEYLHIIAKESNVDFETLLEMVSENDLSPLKDEAEEELNHIFDLIDDTLLALNLEFGSNTLENPSEWIDDYFRKSLACIQEKYFEEFNGDDVISFLISKNNGLLKIVGEVSQWKGLVSSSIPIRSGLYIKSELSTILRILADFQNSKRDVVDTIIFLQETESFIADLPSSQFGDKSFSEEITELWVKGKPISSFDDSILKKHNEYYGYTLPWGINGIAKILSSLGLESEAKEYETLAVLAQMGLPSMLAVKIYLAGIQSRVAATELSRGLNPELEEVSIRCIRDNILHLKEEELDVSENTIKWVTHFKSSNRSIYFRNRTEMLNFKLEEASTVNSKVINAKRYNGITYLCSPDYDFVQQIKESEDFPIDKVANNLGISFINSEGEWRMLTRNPYLKTK